MATSVEKKQEGLKNFKFEANLSVFGSEVTLKPMEGDEIGFRAPQDERGIVISQSKLVDAGLIEKDGTAAGLIPTETEIRTLIYNRKTEKVEFAVKAEFFGPITPPMVRNLIRDNNAAGSLTNQKAIIGQLIKWCTERGITVPSALEKDAVAEDNYATELAKYYTSKGTYGATDFKESVTETLAAYKGFILNRYPQIFTVNSVAIYVGGGDEPKKVEAPKD